MIITIKLRKAITQVILIVKGAFRTIQKACMDRGGYIDKRLEIGVTTGLELLQKSALLGSARTLKMVLET